MQLIVKANTFKAIRAIETRCRVASPENGILKTLAQSAELSSLAEPAPAQIHVSPVQDGWGSTLGEINLFCSRRPEQEHFSHLVSDWLATNR